MLDYYPWIKIVHLVFVMSWFSGLLYLPRFFVNLAEIQNPSEREHLLSMAKRLVRFMHPLMGLAILFGTILWLHYGIGKGSGWMHIKLLLVLFLVFYQIICSRFLKKFQKGLTPHSGTWFRWFNEIPAIILIIVVALVIIKPF